MRAALWFIVFFLYFQCYSVAGDSEIPEKIKKSFQLKFPNASEIKWERINGGRFEVGFVENGKENLALINNDGTIEEIESEMQPDDLPRRIIASVRKKYPYAVINYATKVMRNSQVVAYELEIKNGSEDFDISLNPLGYEVN